MGENTHPTAFTATVSSASTTAAPGAITNDDRCSCTAAASSAAVGVSPSARTRTAASCCGANPLSSATSFVRGPTSTPTDPGPNRHRVSLTGNSPDSRPTSTAAERVAVRKASSAKNRQSVNSTRPTSIAAIPHPISPPSRSGGVTTSNRTPWTVTAWHPAKASVPACVGAPRS